MARTVEPISDETFGRIVSVLVEWAMQHPSPDLPVLMILDGSELTPRDISKISGNWDSLAAQTIRMLFSAALRFEETFSRPGEAESLEGMLAVFQRESAQFRGPRL